jgi:hypothetical protein
VVGISDGRVGAFLGIARPYWEGTQGAPSGCETIPQPVAPLIFRAGTGETVGARQPQAGGLARDPKGWEVHTPPIERRRQTTRHPQANGGAEGSTQAGMAVRVYGHGSFKGSQGMTTRLRIDNLRQPPTTRATTRQLDGAEATRAMAVATFRETFRETRETLKHLQPRTQPFEQAAGCRQGEA